MPGGNLHVKWVAEFSEIRSDETQAGFKAVREEIQAQREETKTEFKTQRETIISLLERMAHLEGLLESQPLRS